MNQQPQPQRAPSAQPRPAARPPATAERPAAQPLPPTTPASTALAATTQNSVVLRMAEAYGVTKDQLWRNVMSLVVSNNNGRRADESQIISCLMVADRYKLDPWLKQIHFFFDKSGNLRPVVGIDGWSKILNQQPDHDGLEFLAGFDEVFGDRFIECTLHHKSKNHPTVVREYLGECKRNTDPWKMENRMLRHRALIQAVRIAYGIEVMDEEDYFRMREWENANAEAKAPAKAKDKPKGAAGMTEQLQQRRARPSVVEVEAQVVAPEPQPEPEQELEQQPAEGDEAPWEAGVAPTERTIAGLYMDESFLTSFDTWADDLILNKPTKGNPLSGYTWRQSVESATVTGGRFAVLNKAVGAAVKRQAEGDPPTDFDCRAAVTVHLILERERAKDSGANQAEGGFPTDNTNVEDPG